jgi:MerR family mercuric resistance operon transcriptional regulator
MAIPSLGTPTIRLDRAKRHAAERGAIRRYDEPDLKRLRFIRRAAADGFKLAEIAELIAVLEGARTALGRLRKTCTSGTKGPCPILEAFEE